MDRRRFLALAGYSAAVVPVGGLAKLRTAARIPDSTGTPAPGPRPSLATPVTSPAIVSTGAPFRPPAVPLAVRSPYLHAWLPSETLPGTWAMRWNGQETQLAGIVRIDGNPWIWAGAPAALDAPMAKMRQQSLYVTPTRSIFTMQAAGVRLDAEFLSPIEPGTPRLQAAPLSLLTVTVTATDGRHHDVQLYADISGAWASGTVSDEIEWTTTTTDVARYWMIELSNQEVFAEHGQMAAWGSMLWSTSPQRSTLSYGSGWDSAVRGQFARRGALASTVDPRFRAIEDEPPVFAYCHDLGRVGAPVTGASFVLGHVRNPAISYLESALEPAWSPFWNGSFETMVDDFFLDARAARARATALDRDIIAAATKRAGPGYAQLCTLAPLQTYGACELVEGQDNRTWAFLKEIGSGDATSTVDIITSASPLWLYLDPEYLAMLLDPILSYAGSGAWHAPFAPHDLGYFYPTAEGHAVSGDETSGEQASGEQMPVQESAGLLVLAEAYAQRVNAQSAVAFLSRFERLWSGWVDWLAGQLPAPPTQITTDDFLGAIDHSVNLALLGIVGLGAAGRIFARLGAPGISSHWTSTAESLIPAWQKLSMDPSGSHLDLIEGKAGSWGTTYNAYLDSLLGTNLVPAALSSIQAAWYDKQIERYGLALESAVPHWARVDWESWTAAWLADYPVGQQLIDAMASYVNETAQRVPFSDTYWTTTGSRVHVWPVFDRARPVVGALFAPMTLPQAGQPPA